MEVIVSKRRACSSIHPAWFGAANQCQFPRAREQNHHLDWAFIIESMVRQLSLGTCDHVLQCTYLRKASLRLERNRGPHFVPYCLAGCG
jgi:hypothetical protein